MGRQRRPGRLESTLFSKGNLAPRSPCGKATRLRKTESSSWHARRSEEFVARLDRRLAHQKQLLDLSHASAPPTAWLFLLCAVPRANHLIRSLPPDIVREFAEAHDKSIWSTFQELIGYPQDDPDPRGEGEIYRFSADSARRLRLTPTSLIAPARIGQRGPISSPSSQSAGRNWASASWRSSSTRMRKCIASRRLSRRLRSRSRTSALGSIGGALWPESVRPNPEELRGGLAFGPTAGSLRFLRYHAPA